ncbi:cyanogenic beta-glucosidase-like [Phalaenopsis equestris]|uniref:cyanogenic beta-glucosidase-like n=1 Tax=Phalaenopsis equestris TaxID=78828 RepID=UPI0009E3172A|nr:cyanogenic beta-glucosidase-like [Phalaenopsis equestris]
MTLSVRHRCIVAAARCCNSSQFLSSITSDFAASKAFKILCSANRTFTLEDVGLLADLGLDAYRFSISWPRILPHGRGKVNPEGIQYYKNLIDELLDNGIEPFVTLFHWDLPQALEDEYGGFLSKRILEDFKNYAKVCYEEFGDKVKHWMTLNEPWTFSTLGYGEGALAPGRCTQGLPDLSCPAGGDSLIEPYIVSHNMLLAHSEAAKLYKNHFQAKQQGKVGITLPSYWFEPYDKNPSDKEAQQRALEFNLGWYVINTQYIFNFK